MDLLFPLYNAACLFFSIKFNNLKDFDDIKTSPSSEWYEFSVDNTMVCVESLFKACYEAKNKPLNGVIQIFNLFNIRDANILNI